MNQVKKQITQTVSFLIVVIFCLALVQNVSAEDTTTDLVTKIEERTSQIKQLEEEIRQYNIEVDNSIKQAVTLKNTLKTLDLTKKKIGTDINLTENKINKTVLTIEQLGDEIKKTQNSIDVNKEVIIDAIQDTQMLEKTSIVEIMLSK